MSSLDKIAVIGAGLMGHGIAQVFALAGKQVTITDVMPESLATVKTRIAQNLKDLELDPTAVERVTPCASLADAVRDADFVVEAAREDLDTKRALFAEIERHAKPDAILATNTSVIPITAIMAHVADGTRTVGTHWWNPPFLVPLVEVISTDRTSQATVDATIRLHTEAGKVPVHVKKDVAGFVGNRLQHALWREAISLIENDICDAATVDTVIKASFGRRLAVLGPIENADLVGTDLTLAIHNTVLSDIESRPGPSPYLEELVASGKLGMKSGEGFLKWTPEQQQELRARVFKHLAQALKDERK